MTQVPASKPSRLDTLLEHARDYATRENAKGWKERLGDRFSDVFHFGKGIGKSGLSMLQQGVLSSPPGILLQEVSRLRRISGNFEGYKNEQKNRQQSMFRSTEQALKHPAAKLQALWNRGLDALTNRAVEFLRSPRSRQVEAMGIAAGNAVPLILGKFSTSPGYSGIPGGSLKSHEGLISLFGAPTHLIEKHVGKSLPQMLERLTQQRSRQISSFRNLREAERFVSMALRKERNSVQKFATSALSSIPKNNRLILDVALGKKTGHIVRQGSLQLKPAHGVRLILDKIPNTAKLPFVIFTGFPIK